MTMVIAVVAKVGMVIVVQMRFRQAVMMVASHRSPVVLATGVGSRGFMEVGVVSGDISTGALEILGADGAAPGAIIIEMTNPAGGRSTLWGGHLGRVAC